MNKMAQKRNVFGKFKIGDYVCRKTNHRVYQIKSFSTNGASGVNKINGRIRIMESDFSNWDIVDGFNSGKAQWVLPGD